MCYKVVVRVYYGSLRPLKQLAQHRVPILASKREGSAKAARYLLVSACIDQKLCTGQVATIRRKHQGGGAVGCCMVYCCPILEQVAGDLLVICNVRDVQGV